MLIYICWKLPLLKHGLVLDHSFVDELSSCNTSTYPANLFPRAEEGCILFRKSPNWSFSSKGVVLDDGTEVEIDLVVFSTRDDEYQRTILRSFIHQLFGGSSMILMAEEDIEDTMMHNSAESSENSERNQTESDED